MNDANKCYIEDCPFCSDRRNCQEDEDILEKLRQKGRMTLFYILAAIVMIIGLLIILFEPILEAT